MPEYMGKCTNCYKLHRYHSTIKDRDHCPEWCECGGTITRNVEAELESSRSTKKWVTDNERWSISMGVPASQVAEFRKRFPNSTYNDRGDLLVKSRKDKLRQMKERDFVELDKRN